ncbi:potassium channel subfamily K member 6-like isoform X2 [Amphiura filiformis]|uniref:potassium channel subfamily K member 6-like isoform X2 n=1 Tax=Amphiura filiformis TaxID=82378 RepID=UPI003B216822
MLPENAFYRFLAVTAIYATYLCLGSGIFCALEQPAERTHRIRLDNARDHFLQQNPCVDAKSLEVFLEAVETASNAGILIGPNNTVVPTWSFASSLFFSTTLLTTIGYGHMVPLSIGSQIFSILFSLVGIPLTVFFLGIIATSFNKPSQSLLEFMMTKLNTRNTKTGDTMMSDHSVRLLHISMLAILITSFLFLVPALIFARLEPGWTYFDGLYFVYISMTTIGLGDYVPAFQTEDVPYEDLRDVYHLAVTVYLLFGLSMLILLVETVVQIPEVMMKLLARINFSSASLSFDFNLRNGKSTAKEPSEKEDLASQPASTYSTINNSEN